MGCYRSKPHHCRFVTRGPIGSPQEEGVLVAVGVWLRSPLISPTPGLSDASSPTQNSAWNSGT